MAGYPVEIRKDFSNTSTFIEVSVDDIGKITVPRQIITFTHGAEPFLRSCQLCSYLRTFRHFMEPEGSLPCSQEPSTGPYSEPDQFNPYHPILSLEDPF
jgi:hypothetical protein